MTIASSLAYSTLAAQHSDRDAAKLRRLQILYDGDVWDLGLHELKSLLPMRHGEHPQRYRERLTCGFVGYLSTLIDGHASALFVRPIHVSMAGSGEVPPDYEAFAEQATSDGCSLNSLLKKAFTDALLYGRAWVAVDAARWPEGVEIISRAQEAQLGLDRVWADDIDPNCLLDWSIDASGNVDRAVLHYVDKVDDKTVRETFKVWFIDDESGLAAFAYYSDTRPKGRPFGKGRQIPLTDAGVTTFDRVPLIPLELPKGFALGPKLGPLQLEHWQRRSALNAGIAKSIFSVPYVKQGGEVPKFGGSVSEAQSDPARGARLRADLDAKGFIVLGSEDEVGFAEPTGKAYELEAQQLKDLVDEMHRIAHRNATSVTNTSNALARSGLSKAEDRHATETIMGALGELVRQFAVRIYDTISAAESLDVYWTAEGLDKFEVWDRTEIVDEAVKLHKVDVDSPTFRATYATKIAARLLDNVDPETMATIREEVLEGEERRARLDRDTLGFPGHKHQIGDNDDLPDEVA